jgi:hypothetical protein
VIAALRRRLARWLDPGPSEQLHAVARLAADAIEAKERAQREGYPYLEELRAELASAKRALLQERRTSRRERATAALQVATQSEHLHALEAQLGEERERSVCARCGRAIAGSCES